MDMLKNIKEQFDEAKSCLENFNTAENHQRISEAIQAFSECIKKGNKIISCGNGGSMSDAMHFAEEMTGRFREDRRAFPAIAISDPSYLSCVSNDYGYDQVFSRFVEGMGKPGDILLGISTSGNSENVIKAAKAAKECGMLVIALTGKDGGKLAKVADIEIRAPHTQYADRVQEIHIKVIHSFIQGVELSLR
jgi:D-sedoheptulose 7-phosphate isomerase